MSLRFRLIIHELISNGLLEMVISEAAIFRQFIKNLFSKKLVKNSNEFTDTIFLLRPIDSTYKNIKLNIFINFL
jgi:hypothetical protein